MGDEPFHFSAGHRVLRYRAALRPERKERRVEVVALEDFFENRGRSLPVQKRGIFSTIFPHPVQKTIPDMAERQGISPDHRRGGPSDLHPAGRDPHGRSKKYLTLAGQKSLRQALPD
jgi:hypothetical protein